MITKQNFKKIEKWLFEYSPDLLAGQIDIDDEENDFDSTLGEEIPVIPVDQMATQFTRELPPIEDEEYIPATTKELSAATDLIASKCPEDQVDYFYKQVLGVLESAIEKSNSPELGTALMIDDEEIKRPIQVKKESKTHVISRKKAYNANITLGEYMKEAKFSNARYRDFARKWKQGDELEFAQGDDIDYDDLDDDEVEFHPDAEDLMDFMAANEEEDAATIYGSTPETAQQANIEYSLADILRSNIYPKASRESAITNKLEREMFPVLRAVYSAPQVNDRLVSLLQSDYAVEAFLDSMYHADLLSDESLEELQNDYTSVKSSSMFPYFNSIAFVKPTMKELQKLADMGSDVFDPKRKKSQISPEDAKRIIKTAKDAWERKNASQKSKIAQKAITHMSEFEGRDESVMG